MKIRGKLVKPFRVEHGKHFRLKDYDPAHTAGVKTKEEANQLLQEGIQKLADLQDNCDLSRISNPSDHDVARVEKYRKAIDLISRLPNRAL